MESLGVRGFAEFKTSWFLCFSNGLGLQFIRCSVGFPNSRAPFLDLLQFCAFRGGVPLGAVLGRALCKGWKL